MTIGMNLSYNTVCCLLDCVNNSIETVEKGKSVLTLPCDDLKQEQEILEEYKDMLNEFLENSEWS